MATINTLETNFVSATSANLSSINRDKLFTASCVSLLVTSLTFGIRAGILGQLGEQYHLTNTELGQIASMAFLGFPLATFLGGFFVDLLGMRRFMLMAFIAHLLGLILTVFAGGYWTLMISTLLIGFANGTVEAVCNPLIGTMYPENKVAMFNKFHVWFPGGIVIGALLSLFMAKKMGITGQLQCAIIIIPTLYYGYLFFKEKFPQTERVTSGVTTQQMYASILTPLFLFMAACMFLTANTELSTNQWVNKLLGNAGASALLILALVNGIMAFGRFFGEGIIHRLAPEGVLFRSAILATIGIYLLSTTTGPMLYLAAIVFACGVCYFWPTMLGYVSEKMPQSGALGLSIMGGIGMGGNALYQSLFLGPKLDSVTNTATATASTSGLTVNQIELFAGQTVLNYINFLPLILIFAFGYLYFSSRKK